MDTFVRAIVSCMFIYRFLAEHHGVHKLAAGECINVYISSPSECL